MRRIVGFITGGCIIAGGLFIISRYNYLLFHSIAEIYSILIAFGLFLFAWNTREYAGLPFLVFLGITYLYIGILDLLHTLSYKGMQIFTSYDFYANQLWIAARFLESISLVLGGYLIGVERHYRYYVIHGVYLAVTTIIVFSIIVWRIFPVCFIEGQGQTAFKIISEYVIMGILGISLFLTIRHRADLPPRIYRLLTLSIVLTILEELAFTLYVDNYGLSNLIGHYLKIGSFYLIYKAIIETGLKEPLDVVFKRLVDRERELQIANATKDKFFSIIAHDLRNPIGGIYQLTNFLVDEWDKIDNDTTYRSIIGIRESASKTHGLLQNLLQWAQSQSGRLVLNPMPIDLLDIIEETTAPLLGQAEEKEIEVAYRLDPDITVFADLNMLTTVIRNLFSNAIKFTPRKGRISVSTARIDDTWIRMAVEDTGVGIDVKDQDKLFRTDTRVSNEGTDGESGTGFGLLLCKELVEKNKGEIGFESNPGSGTTFWFTVPVAGPVEA